MPLLYRTASEGLAPLNGPPVLLPSWCQEAHEGFHQIILGTHPLFPCYFASIAERQGSLVYSFLDLSGGFEHELIYSTLNEFFSNTESLKPFPVLALFIHSENQAMSLENDEELFWEVINGINKTRDDWSSSEADPSDSRWVLKYKDIPIFVTGHSPFYTKRLSRYADPVFDFSYSREGKPSQNI